MLPRRGTGFRPTPACAGSTEAIMLEGPSMQAYPRLRGEHWPPGEQISIVIGLPPLARGAPWQAWRRNPR